MIYEVGRRAGGAWDRWQVDGDERDAVRAFEQLASHGIEAAVFERGVVTHYADPAAYEIAKPARPARRSA